MNISLGSFILFVKTICSRGSNLSQGKLLYCGSFISGGVTKALPGTIHPRHRYSLAGDCRNNECSDTVRYCYLSVRNEAAM